MIAGNFSECGWCVNRGCYFKKNSRMVFDNDETFANLPCVTRAETKQSIPPGHPKVLAICRAACDNVGGRADV